MLTNLFSLFDPTTSMFGFSWSILFFVLLFLPCFLWVYSSSLFVFLGLLLFVKSEVSYVIPFSFKGVVAFFVSLLSFLFFLNFFALFPFIFSVTSHMLITLPCSFSFWLGVIIFSWVVSLKYFLAHLVPSGTPVGLMSFMVLVELLSNFIRPLALTFRLTANMMAGHLLMSLVGGFLILLPFSAMLLGSFLQLFLVLMELGVSLIQAYVFSTLVLLYLSEAVH